jgi:hypothetical protein
MRINKAGRLISTLFLVGVLHLLSACSTVSHQTAEFFRQPPLVPEKIEIANVPFIKQSWGTCGPATLAMAMQWAGEYVSMMDLETKVYTPEMKGSIKTDMITATRRQGLLAIPIEGMQALISEIAAGHPVIVFQNLALSWLPNWHYAIAYGYDLPSRELILHTGPLKHHHLNFSDFESSWGLAGYWALVVLPPDRLSVSANEVAHVKAAAGIEQAGQAGRAQKAYQKILTRWPQSLGARIGLANLAFNKSDCRSASQILETAVQDHPTASFAWHNLAIAQGQCGWKQKARQSAARAIELSSPASQAVYQANLSDWL